MMEDIKNIRIEEVCDFLNSVIKVLDKPRRMAILKVLIDGDKCTFKEIQTKTGISTGSLHGHLMELLWAEFIYRTDDRPRKYGRTKFLDYLMHLVTPKK